MGIHTLRIYEPIWLELKKYKTATVQADSALHPRIAKAVIKEKDKDIPYKNLCTRRGVKYTLSIASNTQENIITFSLKDLSILSKL